ncbi:MAG: hypothetical protein AB1758_29850, partial [Candidatus Eremiobacterota bacterium]
TINQDVSGSGDHTQVAVGASNIRQDGAWHGTNNQTAIGNQDTRNNITQDGGWLARNNQTAQGGDKADTINMSGGMRGDSFTYNVTGGRDRVSIDGGRGFGTDSATINGNGKNFSIVDADGNVLYREGRGGTTISVNRLENITVNGADGQPTWTWNSDSGGQYVQR